MLLALKNCNLGRVLNPAQVAIFVVISTEQTHIERSRITVMFAMLPKGVSKKANKFSKDGLMYAQWVDDLADFSPQQFYPLWKLPKKIIRIGIGNVGVELIERSNHDQACGWM
jgi:hypothetical protein